ncbi:hypothetical protein QN277_005433 [Acacia crassicarpa]|uniref:PGG domain-containing protein n=1 Tax=Acacia crassicarpa TaxID=499986 RepID=A0AAE1ME82_9FABA|nr:hypothetical protein QN277_005433 [Acacia crassicarpa]
MGKKSSEIKIEGDMFSETLREAQKAYRSNEWDKFIKIFADNKVDLLKDFDLFGNTAITMAARSKNPEILKELLRNLSEEQKWRAFRKKNSQGNTLLHDIAVNCSTVAMADIVLDFERTTPLPPELAAEEEEEDIAELSEEEKKEREEEKKRPLLEWKNLKGETPVFKAAKFGNLKMLSHLVTRVDGGDMKIHQESSRRETILHASVNNQSFDVALWIIMNMDRSSLVLKQNKNELTCLQLLARMPSAFKGHYLYDDDQGFITKLVYKLLPNEGYDIEGCNSFGLLRSPVRDIETGGQDDARPPTPGYLSRANLAVWKSLAQVFNWIEPIQKEKKKHQLAERLAGFLVKCDYSWQVTYDERTENTSVELPPVLYNVAQRKKELRWKHKKEIIDAKDTKQEDEKLKAYKHYSALLIAASQGIEEILDSYKTEHPASINHVSKEDGQNLLHIAVRHRQEKILDWLEKQVKKLDLHSLASQVNQKNHTALHEVAGLDYYRGSALAGAAFQLQEELEFYKRVEKIVPPHLHMHCDDKRLTAGDLLDIAHDDMLADAQKWIKETAQSCSTVSILVASVVFAAAYTIPGGIEGRSALLLKTPVFIFFTTMDIVALAFSLASVVMFLSILNAPFELWDFHKSLPRKLTLGFAFLFLSLTTTMLAFSATILITIRLQWKEWTSTLVYSAALFPVTVFALIEFPLYMKIPRLFHKFFKKTSVCRSSTRAD